MYSFPYLETICCSTSSSNCCFLICIQISQEAGQVVWYSHLFKHFPICCDLYKGFSVVSEAEVDVFLELSCFFNDELSLRSITMNKASGGDGIPVKLFQILKDDAMKVLHSVCQQIWKTQPWPQDWKRSTSFQFQRKAMPKNAQTTAQLHSSQDRKSVV